MTPKAPAAPPAELIDDDDADGMPRVSFEHPVFQKLGDLHFEINPAGEAVLVVKLAKNEVSLPFEGLKREFGITDESPDALMLQSVAKGLKFVKGLRIGQPLPMEILNREASWQLSERHVRIAYQRVSLQLCNWLTGGQEVISDPDALLQLADDPQIKKQVNNAFGGAAIKLGFGREHKEEVIKEVQVLAHELAYIEALRDRLRHIQGMGAKIQKLRRMYGHERTVHEVAEQVSRLIERAVSEFTASFDEVDAQTGEILSVLRNLDSQISYIRDERDELAVKLFAWEDLLLLWDKAEIKTGPDKPVLLRKTYRFLAPRYMVVKEWVLMTKLVGTGAGVSQLGADGKPKKPINVMRW